MKHYSTKQKPKTHITVQREDVEELLRMLVMLEQGGYNVATIRYIIKFIKRFLLGENI